MGRERLAVTLGTRTVLWDFIVTETGEDEGILGNDFAMAHRLTVRLHEGAVYQPAVPRSGTDDMGECLPCAVRLFAEVRTITKEAFAVRAAERLILAPQTVSQARVTISAMSTGGTVMLEEGPGPLGLCPVRGVAEVNQDTTILAGHFGTVARGGGTRSGCGLGRTGLESEQ